MPAASESIVVHEEFSASAGEIVKKVDERLACHERIMM
jgi:hypothetical protein